EARFAGRALVAEFGSVAVAARSGRAAGRGSVGGGRGAIVAALILAPLLEAAAGRSSGGGRNRLGRGRGRRRSSGRRSRRRRDRRALQRQGRTARPVLVILSVAHPVALLVRLRSLVVLNAIGSGRVSAPRPVMAPRANSEEGADESRPADQRPLTIAWPLVPQGGRGVSHYRRPRPNPFRRT